MEMQSPPTAIFAGNDEAALGVIFAAQERGLRVPDDLSVCGYDDLSLSKNIWPGLTTVHQPAEELLAQAALLLIRSLKGQSEEEKSVTIQSQLVIRGSTAPPPAR
jgi:LacI family transcriptional regulator